MTGIVLLAYGPVGDLEQMRRARIRAEIPKRAAEAARRLDRTDDRLRPYRAFARLLSSGYYTRKSGQDATDIEQAALIAAWEALDTWDPALSTERSHVHARMRFAVRDVVKVKNMTEAGDLRRASYEHLVEEGLL